MIDRLKYLLPEFRHYELIFNEEKCREKIIERIEKVKEEIIKTKILNLVDRTIERYKELLNIKGRGSIREITIISESSNFNVIIFVDEKEFINSSYNELEEISSYSNSIDAFEEDGKYIVHITDISFGKNLRFGIFVNGTTKFNRIYVLYDIISE